MSSRSDIIRQVPVEDTYALRQAILRPGRPLSSCRFPNDNQPGAAHFAGYRNACQVGIVSVYPVAITTQPQAWQLRAMATQPWVRRQGYGRKLLQTAEAYVRNQHGKLLWCNARLNAVSFYQKMDFATSGEQFLIPGVGAHYFMLKEL